MSRAASPSTDHIQLHRNDLPDGISFGDSVAVDSETMGLITRRDRLCVIQLSDGSGEAHLVQFDQQAAPFAAPNLVKLFDDPSIQKIFHFARFDIAAFEAYLGVVTNNIFCTKIASKLVRTYTDRHGLRDLCNELISVDISKQQQSSDWGAATLSPEQQAYAASDVLYLHRLRDILIERLAREGRTEIAQAAFDFLPYRARLDLIGWEETDIFAHR